MQSMSVKDMLRYIDDNPSKEQIARSGSKKSLAVDRGREDDSYEYDDDHGETDELYGTDSRESTRSGNTNTSMRNNFRHNLSPRSSFSSDGK
jgi:hypothetical protein